MPTLELIESKPKITLELVEPKPRKPTLELVKTKNEALEPSDEDLANYRRLGVKQYRSPAGTLYDLEPVSESDGAFRGKGITGTRKETPSLRRSAGGEIDFRSLSQVQSTSEIKRWEPSIWERIKRYVSKPVIEPTTYKGPLERGSKLGAYYLDKYVTGVSAGAPEISRTVEERYQTDLDFYPTPKEQKIGRMFQFMGGLRTAGKVLGPLVKQIPVRPALKTILGTGLTFGLRKTDEEFVKKIRTGKPVDWQGIHFEAGIGELFGAGEVGVDKLWKWMRGFKEATATSAADIRATARAEVDAALKKYKTTGDRTDWDAVRTKYTGAPAARPKAVTPPEVKEFGKYPLGKPIIGAKTFIPTGITKPPTIIEKALSLPVEARKAAEPTVTAPPAVPEAHAEPAVTPAPEAEAVAEIPADWQTKIGKTRTKEGEVARSEIDFKSKTIIFADEAAMHDPEIINHEIAHIRFFELPGSATKSLVNDYIKVADITEKEIEQHVYNEWLPMDYGDYLSGKKSSRLTPEVVAVFEKHFPELAEQAPAKIEGQMKFTSDPTVGGKVKGEAGFAGIPGRPGEEIKKPWLDMERTKSPDKEIEDFFGRTKRPPYSKKASGIINSTWAGLRERFVFTPHLPKVKETAIYRDMIRTMPEERRFAREKAIKDIIAILNNDGTVQVLDSAGLDLLRRKVFVQDILHEAEIDRSISGNLTKEQLEAENKRLDELIEKVPSVKKAYEARQKLWDDVSQDLLRRGVLDEETAKNRAYVRHFVLDLAEKNRPTGFLRKRLSAPFRAYSKHRKGSVRDISTDYLEVETRALADIYADNAVEDTANKIAVMADNRKHYTAESQKLNIEKAGNPSAELKGFARDKWFRDVLGEEYMSPERLAKGDGYVEWFYKRPSLFYRAKTVTESQIAAFVENNAEEAGAMLHIPVDRMREALVMGRRKGWLIPDWLAAQLDDLPVNKRSNYIVRSFTRPFVQIWKRWILRVNPFRYNARNTLGDTERFVVSGQEDAVKFIPEAAKTLITKKGYYDLMKRYGVVGSSLWHEMNDVSRLKEFERFKDYSKPKTFKATVRNTFALPIRIVSHVGSVEQNLTQFREDILRAATFISNYQKLQEGKPVRHWAGKLADINEIAKSDKARAAAKISRETLGDYGEFTPFENDVLRQGIIPFYSWMKINTKFWPRVLYEAGKEGTLGKSGLAMAPRMGLNVAKWLIRALWLYGAAYWWNHRDDKAVKKEESLPFWLRAMPHVNIGDYTLWGQTALSDFVEWADMESLAGIYWRFDSGLISKEDAAKEAAKIIAKAPVDKTYQSLSPYLKSPVTAITGMETWPSVFEPHFVASPASTKSLERAIVNILGADAKRYYETAKGNHELEDTLYAYFAGWFCRPTDPDTLIADIKRTKEWTSLKRKSKVTGRGVGEAKKGKEAEWQEMKVRERAL